MDSWLSAIFSPTTVFWIVFAVGSAVYLYVPVFRHEKRNNQQQQQKTSPPKSSKRISPAASNFSVASDNAVANSKGLETSLEKTQQLSATDVDGARNLLPKKPDGPPSTIKESSESSQTIDDNESDKGSGQLKHENTVVRADGVSVKHATNATTNNTAPASGQTQDIIRVTQQILDAISSHDMDGYMKLCDPNITIFEPEGLGNLIHGLDFHRFYFELPSSSQARKNGIHNTVLNPNVHLLSEESACIAYVRLMQYIDKNGEPRTRQTEETRVWQRKTGRWVCSHVHRSSHQGSSADESFFPPL